MKSPLIILHLEDNPNDAKLVQFALEADGIHCVTTLVQNHPDFAATLEGGGFDLILSDFSLPTFDGMSALTLARAKWPMTPFIFVSGTLGEERAIVSLKSGATDYVLKGNLARLAPAVRRAMKEVEDRCERSGLEARSIESQKMDGIGQLAGGVAHDFNNILAVIIGYSDLLAMGLGAGHPMQLHNEKIRHASERAVGLTRQLLVFSRKQTVVPVILDLNKEVQDMDKMLRRLVDENIELIIVPGEKIGRIKADSGYVGQVLMNTVVNARDAMPNGGALTIATSNVTLDTNYAQLHQGVAPGDYVMVSVSDTGTGMSEEVKAHLFEAFFTTKPVGKGTGLGLATCQTIVRQSGGHIGVDSELGRGTTFKIYFPQVAQAIESATLPTPVALLPRGTETLLIVEDEPSVRFLAREVLENQGYQVLLAANGRDALKLVRQHTQSPISLVVTDVIMPLMGGKVMAEWLATMYPDLKILFTSGYTDDALAHHGVLEAGIEFLPKPYTPGTLVRKVREMLNTPPTRVAAQDNLQHDPSSPPIVQ